MARSAIVALQAGGLPRIASMLRYHNRSPSDYESWIARHDTLTEADLDRLRSEIAALPERPLISVLMPVFNTPEHLLREAIASVIGQVYDNWELCIADDCSTAGHVGSIIKSYAALDSRIRWVRRAENGHISRASNSALDLVRGDWVALLDHDDVLRPHALAEVAREIAAHPTAELIYSDEDKLSRRGERYDPFFKPDFSRELFRSQNYLNHLTVHRTANIRAVGGWRVGFEGSQDYDLNLRICERIGFKNIRHIPKVLYHWRAVEGSTAASNSGKDYAYDAGFRALQEHVARLGLPAVVEQTPGLPFYRLHFSVPPDAPLVSLIIPARDRVELLRGSVGSILEKTTYPNYEILIVDNGSTDRATLDYMADLARDGRVRVLRYDHPFNYSAINNFAVTQANGTIIGLVNNDIEVISPGWLDEMVSWAAQPDIGCVGAKLYYANETIQHAGIILGIGGVAGHSHKYFGRHELGYFARLHLVQNLSAVTGACLVVRKDVFESVAGLNEIDLTVAFNDVDFCLRVGQLGLSNVWTPYAELYHLESISRGAEDDPVKQARFLKESEYMKERWALAEDPYYSINLTLEHEDFSLAR